MDGFTTMAESTACARERGLPLRDGLRAKRVFGA